MVVFNFTQNPLETFEGISLEECQEYVVKAYLDSNVMEPLWVMVLIIIGLLVAYNKNIPEHIRDGGMILSLVVAIGYLLFKIVMWVKY